MNKDELSWKKELELAETYAKDGPYDVPKSYMERCLENAIEKAKKEKIDVSKEVKRIRKIWDRQE